MPDKEGAMNGLYDMHATKSTDIYKQIVAEVKGGSKAPKWTQVSFLGNTKSTLAAPGKFNE